MTVKNISYLVSHWQSDGTVRFNIIQRPTVMTIILRDVADVSHLEQINESIGHIG